MLPPSLPDDRFEWTPREIARWAGLRTYKVTRLCRRLESRRQLQRSAYRWHFDYATANRIYHAVLHEIAQTPHT